MNAPRKLPGNLDTNRLLAHWLRINSDGTVTVYTGKVEIGQGILTAITQVVADELDVSPERIRLQKADTVHGPNEGITSGSRSIEESAVALRYACAETRELLLQRAAARLGVSLEKVTVADGVVRGGSGSVTYWALADDRMLEREATAQVAPKPAAEHKHIGAAVPRRDLPAKITGVPSYVQDMDLPGMLYGRIVRPPAYAARLTALDDAEVKSMPGVVAVVRDGSFIGVVAKREEQAVRAARRLARIAQWLNDQTLPADMTPGEYLLAQPARVEMISEKSDPAAVQRGTSTLTATYTRPYIAHASMGPSCAVAQFENGGYRIWTHSQGIFPLRNDMAKALGVAPEYITVTHTDGAGCYGHNGADDVALDAALLARAVAGRPVQVQWMREDEFAWEPYGPAMVVKTQAALDAGGNIVDWQLDVWSYPHSTRPEGKDGVNLIAAWHLADAKPAATPANPPLPAGGSHRNAVPLYDFPNQRVTNHLVMQSPLRASALRALGAHANVFAIESFMDELAQAAGIDAVEFRLRHLKDPRARAVIEAVAQMSGWASGAAADGARGRGIGFARYKNLGCYVAVVAEVDVESEPRMTRAWAAVEVGLVVNPDGVINQIEGGIVQAASMTLKEAVTFDRERITSRTWDDYPVMKFSEAPLVEVRLLNRTDLPPVGAGEGATGPTAAAIANAVAAATGARVRDMPVTRARIISVLTG
jgi:CO/xanthine dehydrogenase Mo-binding subunit